MRETFTHKMQQSAKVVADTKREHKLDRLQVHRVVRVENPEKFESYQRERTQIRSRLGSTRAAGHTVAQLEEHAPTWLAAKEGFPAVIESGINEFTLWHGTTATIDIPNPDGSSERKETWEVLGRHGLDERVGGKTNGGLYGDAIYLTDTSSKANQYASKHKNDKGWHCMLSCRAVMGDPFMTKKTLKGFRRPPNNRATSGLPFDSVFAEEGVTDNSQGPGSQFHNEYVVFKGAQVYVEYVIWYTC